MTAENIRGIYRICGGMGDMYEVGGVNRQLAELHRKLQLLPVSGEIHSADLDNTYEYNCNAGRLPNGRGSQQEKN